MSQEPRKVIYCPYCPAVWHFTFIAPTGQVERHIAAKHSNRRRTAA